jgi:hypothetical protein
MRGGGRHHRKEREVKEHREVGRTEKPNCPDHPKAGVVAARTLGTFEERWRCMECRSDLGHAGFNTGRYEPMTVKKKYRLD